MAFGINPKSLGLVSTDDAELRARITDPPRDEEKTLVELSVKLVLQMKPFYPEFIEHFVGSIFDTRFDSPNAVRNLVVFIKQPPKMVVAGFQLVNFIFQVGEFVNEIVFIHIFV